MRPSRVSDWLVIIAILASGCVSGPLGTAVSQTAPAAGSGSFSGPPTTGPSLRGEAGTSPSASPISTLSALIDHADGPTDVVLRFDVGPGDFGPCELCGGWGSFTPGPEFTLYGDGSVLFRHVAAEAPLAGAVSLGHPFRLGRIDEARIQSLLRDVAAVGLLGLSDHYDFGTDNDDPTHSVFTIRAGGVDKRVDVYGPGGRFATFAGHLPGFDRGTPLSTKIWAPERYWGLLIEISPLIAVGVLADVPLEDRLAWPWPWIEPWAEPLAGGRRVMSRDEIAIFGDPDEGGVVRQVFLVGPDRGTIYSYSEWPLMPDDMDRA
jgi:hypothetical protein